MLTLSQIRIDGGTQPRESINHETVTEYAEALKDGAVFPPVTVFHDGKDYWLADGFHRRAAHKAAGRTEINAEILQGTRRDAILHSMGANAAHGLRRTNADKRRAVMVLLRDDEWSQWADREIARRCAVHWDTVGKIRKEMSLSETDRYEAPTERKVERNGTTYTLNTSNIGKQERTEPRKQTEYEAPVDDSDDELYDEEEEILVDTDDEYKRQLSSEDAVFYIRDYIDELLTEVADPANKHHVVNEILKYCKTLSIELNKQSIRT